MLKNEEYNEGYFKKKILSQFNVSDNILSSDLNKKINEVFKSKRHERVSKKR